MFVSVLKGYPSRVHRPGGGSHRLEETAQGRVERMDRSEVPGAPFAHSWEEV